MTKHIFYDSKLTNNNDIWILDNEEVGHIIKSFRMKIGDKFYLSNKKGLRADAKIEKISKNSIDLKLSHFIQFEEPRITIIQGITKNENKDSVEILSELGIKEYIPWLSMRSIHPDSKTNDKLVKSYQNFATIGSKIARSPWVPTISKPLKTIDIIKSYKRGLVFSELSNDNNFECTNDKDVVVVGPEGGIANEELELFEKANWEIVSLGSRILSSKTASIMAFAKINNKN